MVGAVGLYAVEAVDGEDEWYLAAFEEVHRGEAVVEPAGVGEHDGAEGALASSSHMNQDRCCPGVPNR